MDQPVRRRTFLGTLGVAGLLSTVDLPAAAGAAPASLRPYWSVPAQEATVRDILADCDGLVRWGGDQSERPQEGLLALIARPGRTTHGRAAGHRRLKRTSSVTTPASWATSPRAGAWARSGSSVVLVSGSPEATAAKSWTVERLSNGIQFITGSTGSHCLWDVDPAPGLWASSVGIGPDL
jgi:hypothetical protein